MTFSHSPPRVGNLKLIEGLKYSRPTCIFPIAQDKDDGLVPKEKGGCNSKLTETLRLPVLRGGDSIRTNIALHLLKEETSFSLT